MDLKVAKSNPKILLSHKNKTNILNFKLAFTVSKKVSKKSVIRNRIRRLLQEDFLKSFKREYNHIPYWVLVNLKGGYFYNYENDLIDEFQYLMFKTGLFK